MPDSRLPFALPLALGLLLLCGVPDAADAQIQIQIAPGGGPVQIMGPGARPKVDVGSGSRMFVEDRRRTKAVVEATELIDEGEYEQAITLLQSLLKLPDDSFVPVRLSDESVKLTEEPEVVEGPVLDPNGAFTPPLEPTPVVEEDPVQYRGLKSEVLRLISTLPPGALKAYQTRFGPRARAIFEDGLNGDPGSLEEVVRDYFYTPAGHEAAYLLGSYHLDRGSPFSAALLLSRIQKSPLNLSGQWEPYFSLKLASARLWTGEPEAARDVLAELKELAGPRIRLAGRDVPLYEQGADELAWLISTLGELRAGGFSEDGWLSLRGSPGGQTVSRQASPIWEEEWSYDCLQTESIHAHIAPTSAWLNSGLLERRRESLARTIEQMKTLLARDRKEAREDARALIPASVPIVVDGDIVFRGVTGMIKQIDGETGALNAVEGALGLRAFTKIAFADKPLAPIQTPYQQQSTTTALEQYTHQRAWRDLTAGVLSSDGAHVYAVRRLGVTGASYSVPGATGSAALEPTAHNLLAASKLSSLLGDWLVGSTTESKDTPGPFTDHFFLGPPLPIGEDLYVLAEVDREIRLLCLNDALDANGWPTVQATWSQSLVGIDRDVLTHPTRRTSGLVPAYSDGVMVCPTSSGAIVAIDLSQQMLLWGYQYKQPEDDGGSRMNPFARVRFNPQAAVTLSREDRWVDSAPVITGGYVLVTPTDGDELLCLNLSEQGRLAWKRPRGEGLYLAGVHDGVAIVVGTNQVSAYRVNDGSEAWPEPIPIPPPSGRGYLADGHYHLPLSTGEIATVDVAEGLIVARSRGKEGFVPGNLVAVNGKLISLSPTELVAFRKLSDVEADIQSRLANKPGDAAALAQRGTLRLARGETEGGLADLFEAAKGDGISEADRTLAETLLERLRVAKSPTPEEIEKVRPYLVTDEQKTRLLRIEARGLLDRGELVAAFERFVDLGRKPQPSRINGSLSSRSDRWARRHLREIIERADDTVREQLATRAAAMVEEATYARDRDELLNLVRLLPGLPAADAARAAVVPLLPIGEKSSPLVGVLAELRDSSDPERAGFAAAYLAELYVKYGKEDLLPPLLEELKTDFAEVVVLDGKTGAEYAADLTSDPVLKVQLDRPGFSWAGRRLEASETKKTSSIQSSYPVTFTADVDPEYADWRFALDQQRQNLVGFDGTGRRQLTYRLDRRTSPSYLTGLRIRDHLMVLTVAGEFHVVDLLADTREGKLLWKGTLTELADPMKVGIVRVGGLVMNGGGLNMQVVDSLGRSLGRVGPLLRSALVYQTGTDLVARDPRTGATLWRHANLPTGSLLFGDDERVAAWDPDSRLISVFRVDDGSRLSSLYLDAPGDPVTASGGLTLSFWVQDEKTSSLRGVSALTGETLWEHTFSADAKWTRPGASTVFVLDTSEEAPGLLQASAIDLDSGAVELSVPVDTGGTGLDTISRLYVQQSTDGYLLLTDAGDPNNNVETRYPVGVRPVMISGPAAFIDRATSAVRWTTKLPRIGFDTAQASTLPVVVFASRINKWVNPPNQPRRLSQSSYEYSVLDRRTGRKIIGQAHGSNANLSRFEVLTFPERKEIEVRFYKLLVKLSLTDKPLPQPMTIVEALAEEAERLAEEAEKAAQEKDKPQERQLPQAPPAGGRLKLDIF